MNTPRTEAAINAPMDGPNGLSIVTRLTDLCAQLEGENAALREERSKFDATHDWDAAMKSVEAARLLHEALEITCWHFHACYPAGDSATKQIMDENRALLEKTRTTAGRDGA